MRTAPVSAPPPVVVRAVRLMSMSGNGAGGQGNNGRGRDSVSIWVRLWDGEDDRDERGRRTLSPGQVQVQDRMSPPLEN